MQVWVSGQCTACTRGLVCNALRAMRESITMCLQSYRPVLDDRANIARRPPEGGARFRPRQWLPWRKKTQDTVAARPEAPAGKSESEKVQRELAEATVAGSDQDGLPKRQ